MVTMAGKMELQLPIAENAESHGVAKTGDSAMLEGALTEKIVGAFYRVHTQIGFGFPESVYANALAVELDRRRLQVRREVPVEVVYEGVSVGRYRLDMVVEESVLIEVKSTKLLSEADTRQILTYLKATYLEVGLLLHFGPKASFKRFVYTNARKPYSVR